MGPSCCSPSTVCVCNRLAKRCSTSTLTLTWGQGDSPKNGLLLCTISKCPTSHPRGVYTLELLPETQQTGGSHLDVSRRRTQRERKQSKRERKAAHAAGIYQPSVQLTPAQAKYRKVTNIMNTRPCAVRHVWACVSCFPEILAAA